MCWYRLIKHINYLLVWIKGLFVTKESLGLKIGRAIESLNENLKSVCPTTVTK